MGLFLECLNSVDSQMEFRAKYCTVFFVALNESDCDLLADDLPLSLLSNQGEPIETMSNFNKPSVSFCIPSTCSASDLRSAVAQGVRDLSLVSITSEDYCYTLDKIRDDKEFDFGAIITWYLIII